MFSSRVSSVGLSKYLASGSTHVTPVSGVLPFLRERLYDADSFQKQKEFIDPKVVRQPFSTRGITATVSTLGSSQIRYVHTDVRCPDFAGVRRRTTADPTVPARDTNVGRKAFSYAMLLGATTGAAIGTKSALSTVTAFISPAKDVLALAKVEIDLSSIPVGKAIVVKWRGKPLFIRHRTSEEIDDVQSVSLAELRDPQTDGDRVQKPEWLVVLGICTHLGCVPISHAGEYNGYFCPCHGSHYDASGRIRKGPAPLNLEIPPYEFPSDSLLVVG